MKKRSFVFLLIIVMITGYSTVSNNSKTNNDSSNENLAFADDSTTLDDLKYLFEEDGYTFSYENASKSFLEGDKVNVTLNDQKNIQVFIYESKIKADSDTQHISADGFTYERDGMTSITDWYEPPHFFKYNNIIILYVGSDEALLNFLSDNFGVPIAGE
ncbi:MAG: hypothetical protein ACERKN_20205 [Velocimicrobium sp.]